MSAQGQVIILGENITTSNGTAFGVKGGKYVFTGEATWSAGSAKLQIQTRNGTWVDVASSTLSANGMLQVELPQGQVRVVVATATAFYGYLVGIPQ